MAADFGVSPNVIDVDTVSKYIVMEKMDNNLMDLIKNQGTITKKQQKDIIKLYKTLDKAKVFHRDVNLLNYMYRDEKLYLIDFGMAKEITSSIKNSLGTDKPNMQIMPLVLALKIRDIGLPVSAYDYILKYLTVEQLKQYNF
jgi:tRNA A-37 threonylcarbamoyl transferase component Bud32